MRRDRLRTAAAVVAIFALNAYLTLRLFRVDYTAQMGSIEGVYIGLARYAAGHFRDLGWFPLWYGGIPYADSYPPLLNWVCGLAMLATGAAPGLAYHFVTATLYSLGPVLPFWLAWRLSGKRACALVLALGYSVLSPTCLLVPRIAGDSGGIWGERRLQDLTAYGEGPHIASLCLLPLAILLLHLALVRRASRPAPATWRWAFTALAVAAIPMCNWLGGVALAMGIAAYLFAGYPEEQPPRSVALRIAGLAAYAYALAAPWIPPSTIALIRANAPRVGGTFAFGGRERLYALAAALVFLGVAWLLARVNAPRHTRFAVLFAVLTGAVNLGSGWFGISLLPQPWRYQLEMDMAFWAAAVFAVWPLIERLSRRDALAIAVVLALPVGSLVVWQRRDARSIDGPIDIRTTVEYKAAVWLDTHMPGARVFAPGSFGYWLNAFGDTAQITGGFDNGITNPVVWDLEYWMFEGELGANDLELMRAYGVDAVIAGGKDSAEFYKPIKHPEKFAGAKELWREGGDAIYDTGRRSRSLAHVMRPGDLPLYPPQFRNHTMLRPYLEALENPAYPDAQFRWLSPGAASIGAPMQADQVLSVQVSWDKGWSAIANGRPASVRRDKLGLIVVEPHCSGPCRVELRWDGGIEMLLARIACVLAALWTLIILTQALYAQSLRIHR